MRIRKMIFGSIAVFLAIASLVFLKTGIDGSRSKPVEVSASDSEVTIGTKNR